MSSPRSAGRERMHAIAAHLRELLEPVVARTGCEVEDVEVSAAGRRTMVRLIVDADSGVDLDAIAEVSRAVSEAIDADAQTDRLLAGAYVLEVSSPGVDRPLTRPTQWRRATGRLVRAELRGTMHTGRVVHADTDGVRLDVDGGVMDATWSEVGPGRVQVEFSHAAEHAEPEEG